MKHLPGMAWACRALWLFAVAVLLAGCAQTQTSNAPYCRPNLLFDYAPTVTGAEQFATRARWQTAPSHLRTVEDVYYQESFYDRQGNGRYLGDYYRRRFMTVREGRAYR